MSLAYCLLVHKSPNQLIRLMRAIYHRDNYYVIHVDKDAPMAMHAAVALLAKNNKNITKLKSISCYHSGYSLVRAQNMAMAELLRMGDDWSHFINLSGEDFPLKNQSKIIDELKQSVRSNFLDIFDPFVMSHWKRPDDRFDGIYWEPPKKKKAQRIGFVRMPRRWIINGKIYGGSQWVMLSREFCAYLGDLSVTWNYKLFFRNTFVPDESFYHTLIMNSSFCDTVIEDNRRYIDWVSGPERPKVLRGFDIPEMMRSSALFARKFNEQIDPAVMCELEKNIYSGVADHLLNF